MFDIRFRHATREDIDTIVGIYDNARRFMRTKGNHSQWVNGYPAVVDIEKDIAEGNLYVGTDESDKPIVVFALIFGEDPTYKQIYGKWLNEDRYATIHRIASDGSRSGTFEKCIEYCQSMISNIRIDTHKDNLPMLNALKRRGFTHCGVIICRDGTPREAFQLFKLLCCRD